MGNRTRASSERRSSGPSASLASPARGNSSGPRRRRGMRTAVRLSIERCGCAMPVVALCMASVNPPGLGVSGERPKACRSLRDSGFRLGVNRDSLGHGKGTTMGKPHPMELRERVVAFVEEGNSHREAARHFRVSPRFVNNMMILHRLKGSVAPGKQGHPPGGGKLMAHSDWIGARVASNGDVTLDELCVELTERGVMVHRATIGRFLHRLGLSNKKKPHGQRTTAAGDRPRP